MDSPEKSVSLSFAPHTRDPYPTAEVRHALAGFFSRDTRTLCLCGPHGSGKTSSLQDFAQHWPEAASSLDLSFDDTASSFRSRVLGNAFGDLAARSMAWHRNDEAIGALKEWNGLLVLDHYEALQERLLQRDPEACAIQEFLTRWNRVGGRLLIATTFPSAGFPNESTLHMPLLHPAAARDLFISSAFGSPQAPLSPQEEDLTELALRVTQGLAYALRLMAHIHRFHTAGRPEAFKTTTTRLFAALKHRVPDGELPLAGTLRLLQRQCAPETWRFLELMALLAIPILPEGLGALDMPLTPPQIFPLVRVGALDKHALDDTGELVAYTIPRALAPILQRASSSRHRKQAAILLGRYGHWLGTRLNTDDPAVPWFDALVRQSRQALHRAASPSSEPSDPPGFLVSWVRWQACRGDAPGALATLTPWTHLDPGLSRGDATSAFDALHDEERILREDRGDLDDALALCRHQFDRAELAEDTGAQATLLFQMGRIVRRQGEPDLALHLLGQGLDLAERQRNHRLRARFFLEISLAATQMGQLVRAQDACRKALALGGRLEDSAFRAAALLQMSVIATRQGRLSRAYDLVRQSLDTAEEGHDLQGQAAAWHHLALLTARRGDLDDALSHCQRGLDLRKRLGDCPGKAAALHQLALIFAGQGNIDAALGLCRQTLAAAERTGDLSVKAMLLHQMTLLYSRQGDLAQARACCQKALELFDHLGDRRGHLATLQQRALIADSMEGDSLTLNLTQESAALEDFLDHRQERLLAYRQAALEFAARGAVPEIP